MRNIILLILFSCTQILFANKQTLDSITILIKNVPYKIQKSNLYSYAKRNENSPEKALLIWQALEKIGLANNDITTQLEALTEQDNAYFYLGDIKKSLEIGKNIFKNYKLLGNKNKLSTAASNLGSSYFLIKDYSSAMQYFKVATTLFKEIGDTEGVSNNLINTSMCYSFINKPDSAINYAEQALSLLEKTTLHKSKGIAYSHLSTLFAKINNYYTSNNYCKLAIAIYENSGINMYYVNIEKLFLAENYIHLNMLDSAQAIIEKIEKQKLTKQQKNDLQKLKYQLLYKSGKQNEAIQFLEKLIKQIDIDEASYLDLKQLLHQFYFDSKNLQKANELMTEIIKLRTDKNNSADINHSLYKHLGNYYAYKNDYKNAWINVDSAYNQLAKESELNQRISQDLLRINDEQEALLKKEKLDALKREQDAQLKKKQTLITAAILGLVLLSIIIFVIYRQSRLRKKANKLLALKNLEIEKQRAHIAEHNKDMTDSISYAKRIQTSILPPSRLFKEYLNEHFVLYMPKDIVSGDFYWIEKQNDIILFAAVDCTGHGVPGALMSVLGFNIINQAVNEKGILEPAAILSHLDYGVNKMLRQSSEDATVKDSMEIGICALNTKTNELQFAGAFNPLYLIINGEFKEIKSDKHIIGMNEAGVVDEFTNHTIQLQKGDCVYLFSDGYADQFGGPNGKKFKYNQLKNLLFDNYKKPMSEQKEILQNTIEDWMKNTEQIDDILIMGVKI